jgi:ABC-type multidrug transport system fused ATPase/permease subunit
MNAMERLLRALEATPAEAETLPAPPPRDLTKPYDWSDRAPAPAAVGDLNAAVPARGAAWPPRGGIEFRDVTLRYRPGAPAALRKVSFTIQPGERYHVALSKQPDERQHTSLECISPC